MREIDVRAELADLLKRLQAAGDREVLQLHCNVEMVLRGPDGEVKDRREIHNLICTAGKNLVLQSDGTSKYPKNFSYIAIGTGTGAAAAGDTALGTESARALSTVSTPGAGTLRFTYLFAAGTGTGAVTESGLLDAASVGNLLARQVFSAINKGASDTLTITWDLT